MVGFLRGNAIKYLSRAGKKDAVEQDIAKAEFYTKYENEYRVRLAKGLVGECHPILGRDL